MSYRMILELAAGRLELPVLPEKLEIKSDGDNETVEVLGSGEAVVLRGKKLREVSIESFFPAVDAPYVTGGLRSPMDCVQAIQRQRDEKKPLRLHMEGFDLDLNTEMAVEDFTYSERGGEVGDIYFALKLKEYRAPAARMVTLEEAGFSAKVAQESRAGEPEAAKTHTVVKGDSLWAISKRAYGDGSKYPALYEKNRAVIDGGNKGKSANRYTIYPGQVFTL